MKSLRIVMFLSALLITTTVIGKSRKCRLTERIGVCTSVSNAALIKSAGGAHVEENLTNFVMPLKSDADFAANRKAAAESKGFERNVKELEAVQPRDIPFNDISIHMGARWIPQEMYTQFMTDLFGIHGANWKGPKSGVIYSDVADSFIVNVVGSELGGTVGKWATKRRTAKDIFDKCNKKLETLTARKLISMSNVKKLFTTDDPIDDLHFHKLLKEDKSFEVEVAPAFRPDKAINIELPTYVPYIAKLADAADVRIDGIDSLCEALTKRIEYFDSVGCVISDHALDVVMFKPADKEKVDKIVKKALAGDDLTPDEIRQYKGYILVHLGKQYSRLHWVQQYHIGALRNNSRRYMSLLGPDTGYDAIEDQTFAENLSMLMDTLDSTDELRDEVETTLILVLNLTPSGLYILLLNYHRVVALCHPYAKQYNGGDDNNPDNCTLFHCCVFGLI